MSQWRHSADKVELKDGSVHIWLSYLNLHTARLKHLYPLLSDAEKARSERFKFYKHRKRFIASHGFMRSVLSLYCNTSAEQLEFSLKEQGKPKLIFNKKQADIRFNLSHSNNLALLAIRACIEVGVDIEFIQKKIGWKKITQRFFTIAEQQALFSLAEEQQKAAFFQLWTRKEAHMKVTGQGLQLSPTQFSVSVPPAPARFIEYLNGQTNTNWCMQDIALPETFKDYAGCLSTAEQCSEVIHYVFK